MVSRITKPTIAPIPGLTADGFYVTMHKGAQAAAEAVGAQLIYQGAAEWNVSLQVPILEAVIAKKPAAILIAPVTRHAAQKSLDNVRAHRRMPFVTQDLTGLG